MSAITSLTAWGILRAPDVVELAAAAGLPLHIAAALLEQESGGGRNIWGGDGVATGGAYVKGAEVTRSAYEQYRRLCDQGSIGSQGVGPVQLTSRGYQVEADRLGGCWDPRANMLVGFRTLANLIRQYGNDGIRRYNGSGPMAERYREQMLAKAGKWAVRIGSNPVITASPPAVPVPSPVPRPPATSSSEDDPMTPIQVFIGADGRFRGASICEAGASVSEVVDKAWVVCGVTWGSADVLISFLGADGFVMGGSAQHHAVLPNNGRLAAQAPEGAVMVTVEGTASPNAILAAAVLTKPRP